MNRRSFLTALTSFAATAVLDPERLLWRAGTKSIFIPTAHREVSDVIDTIEVIRPQVFFKEYSHSIRLTAAAIEKLSTPQAIADWASHHYDGMIESLRATEARNLWV